MGEFETFDKSQIARTLAPTVTLHKRGTITINAGAFEQLGRPAAVELLYARETAILGLRAVDASVAHAAFVRPAHRTSTGPWVISAMAFVKHFGITTALARQWPARLEGHTLVVDLSRPGVVVSRDKPSDPDPPASPI